LSQTSDIIKPEKKNKKEETMQKLICIIFIGALLCTGCASTNSTARSAYNAHLTKGEHYIASANYEKSLSEFTQALQFGEQIKKTKIPTIMLGETYVMGNEIGKASKIADQAIESWPNESSAWELCGKVELKQNSLGEAERSFEKALKLAKKKEDKERLTSLISLTKGLNAYGQANMQSTKQCFSEIKDIKLAKDVKEKSKKYLGVEVAQ